MQGIKDIQKMKTKEDQLIEQINELSTEDLIQLNNAYCREINSDSEIWDNDEDFFDTFFEGKTNEALRAAHFGTYNWDEKYVKFNGYGNLESFSYFDVEDLTDYPKVIAEYALENPSEFDMLDFDFEEE